SGNRPAVAGTPVIVPCTESMASPAGSVPLATDHRYGAVPSVGVIGALNGLPTSPKGTGTCTGLVSAIVIEIKRSEWSWQTLVTSPQKLQVPAAAAVPLIWPDGAIDSPGGRLPESIRNV